jgi:hypothetical protein
MNYLLINLYIALAFFTVYPQNNKKQVEEIFKVKASQEEGFYKFTFPRTDLKVKVGEISLQLGIAFTSWIAFHPMDENTMIMGDLVLLDKEIENVVSKLTESGIDITALHNHIINENPSVMYMHFAASGDATELAKKMREVISLTGTPVSKKEKAEGENDLKPNWIKVEEIMGKEGNKKSNLISFGFPRKEIIKERGNSIPKTMGTHTAVTFQMVDNKAVVTGDYVMTANEVNDVIRVLTENNITITALHNHMVHEEPRLFYMHFWGYAEPEPLAKGIRAALEKTNSDY